MRNKRFYDLYMDYEKLRDNKIFPCDIDMIYECNDGYIIVGEAKLKGYHLSGTQERVLTNLIDKHKDGGVLLEIEHNQRVQDGATSVNIAQCHIGREYYDGKWHVCDMQKVVLDRMVELINQHKYRK